jgi:beta-phosphoglucomutase-like phosphatase (HAD superfamily)
MTREKESAFLDFLAEVRPVEPVYRIAEAYRGRLPMAVASGGYGEVVRKTLDAIGVRGWFGAVVTAEDTARHKPDPDVFLEAARRLGVEPAGCVVFEDTDIGLEAARRAGMHRVDVRPWVSRWG